MLTLFVNTTTREWFDVQGYPFRGNMPELPYKSQENIQIIMVTASDDAGELGTDPYSWERNRAFGSIEGIGAKLTVDSDYIHKLKGSLVDEVPGGGGTLSVITATFSTSQQSLFPAAGTLRLFDGQGNHETLRYSSRNISGSNVQFTLKEGSSVTGSYAAGSSLDVDQAPYAESYYIPERSTPSAGEFGFDLTIDSLRLRETFDYSNTEVLRVAGLEILLFSTKQDGSQEIHNAFLLDSFRIVGTIGDITETGELPDAEKNEIAALVGSLMQAGFDVETRENNGVFEIRTKLANLSVDTWSEWAAIGYQLKVQYSSDNSSWHDTAVDGDKYIRTSVDGGVTWSAGLLFKGADGTNGKDGEPGTPGEDGTPAGFGTPTANATTLETGSNATVSVTASGEDTAKVFTFEFGIPKGERGDSFTPDAIGDTAEKANYDGEAKGFAFLDSTESKLYFKLSDDSGDWSEGTPFGKGDKGDAGESAGFGVPTATVNTLEADSSATVSVTATGENTSKVFNFVFGIPKGKDGAKGADGANGKDGEDGQDGETPVRGTDYYTETDKQELLTELKTYVDNSIANGEW